MDAHEQRRALRERMRQERDGLSPERRSDLDRALRKNLSLFLETPKTILAFYPSKGEPDFLPTLRDRMMDGCPIAFASVHDGKMGFLLAADNGFQFPEEYRGIPQPSADAPLCDIFDEETVCLVPGLAFRQDGYRLGYGGGFYDRFLSDFPGLSVGIAYAFQTGPDFPVFDHDVAVGYICTEAGINPARPRSFP